MPSQEATTQNHPKQAIFLDLTHQVARQINTQLNLDDLLASIVALVQHQLGYDFVGVWLLTEPKDAVILKVAAGSQAQPSFEPAYRLLLKKDAGIISWICHTGQRYLANDVSQDQRYLALPNLPDTRAQFGLPLCWGQTILGVLDVHSYRAGYFEPADQTFLATLADQLAVAIRLAQLQAPPPSVGWDSIFYSLAHDLKEPFQPLLGFSKLLLKTVDTATPIQLREMGAGIHRSAQYVYSFLDGLLLWSKIQMGRLEYDPVDLNLSETVDRLFKTRLAQAQAKQITLRQTIPTSLGVIADQAMLETILSNLLSNALKFTATGGAITISARPLDPVAAETQAGWVEVSITDDGVGISPENKAKLFRAERRHTTLGTAKEQGSGLGLIICRALVEAHHGQLRLESQVNQGTTVSFTLPVVA